MLSKKIIALIATILFIVGLNTASAQSSKKYWVYFSDKGPTVFSKGVLAKSSQAYQKALRIITPKALERRAKTRSTSSLIDYEDLPLYNPYVQQIKNIGGKLAQQVRFLNAASFYLTDEQRSAIAQIPFVSKISPVVILHGRNENTSIDQAVTSAAKVSTLSYGSSLNQDQMINVPLLHEMGITGKGVIVGMLDTGFRWRIHESLNTRTVLAEYDFIQHDSVTANESGDASNQDQHGTLTMSTLGGFKDGQLIGPAFDASFVLGKTEYIPVTDYRWEEDNWAAGIEWLETMGVDLVSSSLGYNTFVDSANYTFANGDFDGRTTISAQAAVRAARLGVLVCNAAGNEQQPGHLDEQTLLTPADADSIISVGAVTFSRQYAYFSSTGPTNDNRIKPDVVSPGVGIYCASTAGASSYFTVQGTSLATPLTAGSAALVLSARPELNPIQVRDAFRNTADTIDAVRFPTRPNNFTGWGLINAFNAALSFGPIFSNNPIMTVEGSNSVVVINVVSKFGIKPTSVILHYAAGASVTYTSIPMSLDSAFYFPTSGRYRVTIPSELTGTLIHFYIDAQDSSSYAYQSPAAVTGNVWQLYYGITDIQPVAEIPSGFVLHQNYPNPFNPVTTIQYELPSAQHVTLKVFNVLGEEVALLVDAAETPGHKTVSFDASSLASGVYFYRLVTPSFSSVKKMMLLR